MNYQEFLEDLVRWGDASRKKQDGFHPLKAFQNLLQKAAKSADHEVFSPFLYLSLSARLEMEDMMLLAAALYTGLCGEDLSPALWNAFCAEAEWYYHSSCLLYEKEWDERGILSQIRISPRLFSFLCGIIPDLRHIAGMDWYHLTGATLPFLGSGIRLYPRIENCLHKISGKKLIYIKGQKGCGRKLNYAHLAAQSHRSLAVIPYETLKTENQLREMRLECLLHHAMYVIELTDESEDLAPLLHWLKDEETIFLLGGRREITLPHSLLRQYLPFSIHTEEVLGDKALFENLTLAYPWECEKDRTDFLGRYNFLPGRMEEILALASSYSLSDGNGRITADYLRQAVLHVSSHSLDKYAKKIKGVYRFQDLILPKLQKQRLSHIVSRVRNRKLVYEEWGFLKKSAYGNGISI